MRWLEDNWPLLLKIAAVLAAIVMLIMLGITVWENRVFFGFLLLGLAVLFVLCHGKRQRGEMKAVILSDFPALLIYFVIFFAVWKQAQEQFPSLKPDAQRQREQQEAQGPDDIDRLFYDLETQKR